MDRVVLVGASGLAREVLAVLRESASGSVLGIVDDNADSLGREFDGVAVLGRIDELVRFPKVRPLLCVGSGAAREHIAERLQLAGIDAGSYATVVDPSVRNPGGSLIGTGSIVLANVTLTADVAVGHHVVVMPGVTLTHDTVIEDFATIAAGVSLGGGTRVRRAAYLGMNASVRQNVTVGHYGTLGMGAPLEPVPERPALAFAPGEDS
jgi:sugar O-acyltransferase (sialic acid O-acetyltransferase NeuD family)